MKLTIDKLKKAVKIRVTDNAIPDNDEEKTQVISRYKENGKWDCNDSRSGNELFANDDEMLEFLDEDYLDVEIVEVRP